MPPVGFEPTISGGERPLTHAVDRAATGTGFSTIIKQNWRPQQTFLCSSIYWQCKCTPIAYAATHLRRSTCNITVRSVPLAVQTRCRCAAACLLGIPDSNSAGLWMSGCCECCVLSGRVLCVGLIIRPEESYRICCVGVGSRSLDNEEALAH